MRHVTFALAITLVGMFSTATSWAGPVVVGSPSVWCFPEYYRIDPVDGTVAEMGFKPIDPAFKKANDVYDAATNAASLVAMKGETVAMQVMVEGAVHDVTLTAEGLGDGVSFIYEGYLHNWDTTADALRYGPEVAVPLEWLGNRFDVVEVPKALPAVPGKTMQAIWVDIVVPRTAKTGPLSGTISVASAGKPISIISVTVDVADLTLPALPTHNLALIQYGMCDSLAAIERDLYVQVHAHRGTIHDIPYSSQRGWGIEGVVPETTLSPVFKRIDAIRTKAVKQWAEGNYTLLPELAHLTERSNHSGGMNQGNQQNHIKDWQYRLNDTLPMHDAILRECRKAYAEKGAGITDWSAFDRRYGPLFDGSAFADGVPLESFELPFNFNWPAPLDTFKKDDPPQSKTYEAIWMAVAKDFVDHAKKKGWTQTQFFVYFNPKDRANNLSMWKGDEPCETRDFLAHKYFNDLTRRAFANAGDVKVAYKLEVGHYECNYVHCRKAGLDDKQWDEAKAIEILKDVTAWAISSHYHGAVDLIRQRIKDEGDTYYRYGSAAGYTQSSMGLYSIAPLAMDDMSSGYFVYSPGRPDMSVFKANPGEKIKDAKVSQHPLHYDASIFGKRDKALLSLRYKALRGVEAHVAAFKAAAAKDPTFVPALNDRMVKYIARAKGPEAGMRLPFVLNNPHDLLTAKLAAISAATGKDYVAGRTYEGMIPDVEAKSDSFHYCVNCGEACNPTKCQWCGAPQPK